MSLAFEVPRFYPILDTKALEEREIKPLAAVESLVEAGVRILQYRHKADWTQTHYDTAKKIARICEKAGVLFVLNDRADFAKLMGAALHLGQDDLPPVAARCVVNDEVIGLSTHNRAQLVRADAEPVEYLSIGPLFATNSKERPDPVVGIENLGKLRALTQKPLVAIGGVTQLNACDVIEAGANSVAVISGLFEFDTRDRGGLRKYAQSWMQLLRQARTAVQ